MNKYEEQFYKKANKVHSYKYDYSKVNYKNSYTKIIIICPTHGEFKQLPQHHVSGSQCPVCAKLSAKDKKSLTTNEFIERADKIHNYKYNYYKTKYNGCFDKVIIICPDHNEFKQSPSDHLKGHGCPECGKEKSESAKFLTNEEFIKKSNVVHNNKYDYSKTKYNKTIDRVIIICPDHGDFIQTPKDHIQGHGCPKCFVEISSGHQELIDIIDEDKIVNDREVLDGLELDIYIPSNNIAIEYNGNYWHSYDHVESINEKKKHYNKYELCKKKGIQLIQIREDEWINKREIVESIIRSKFNNTNRIYARKCELKECKIEHSEFMNKNHIQGGKGCNIAYGLYYNNELVACMSFNKHNKYEWEVTRFANILNHTVVGGASKLFKHFIKEQNPGQILTYADRRYSNGNLYKCLGFKLDGITKSNYCYIKGNNIYSRQQFQKHKLKNKLEIFDPNKTEAENMFMNGYRRLWDVGNYRFIWSK